MQKLIFINGTGTQIDLTSGNFGITNWAGLSNTGLNIQTQQVPFEDGGVFLDALMEQREIEVTVAIYDGNNLELRYQKKRELISALNPKLGEGTLIYTNDYLSRQIKAVPQIPLFENKNSNDAGTLKASVAFSCPSPYWEDVEETSVEISMAGTVIKNDGDIITQVKIEFESNDDDIAFSNPKIANRTTGQEIEVIGNFRSPVFIDTNLGKKSVYQKEIKPQVPMREIVPQEIMKNGGGTDGFIYSDYYNCYLLIRQGTGLLRSLDCENWEFIYNTETTNILTIDNLIILFSPYELSISSNLQDWFEFETSYSKYACRKNNGEYELYGTKNQKLYKTKININDDSITLDAWTVDTVFTGYELTNNEMLIYNPFLDGILIISYEEGSSDKYCWLKDADSIWHKLGQISYNNLYFGYVPETHFMVLFGSQYGYIDVSLDGFTWDRHYITGYVEEITYYEEEMIYIAIGRTSWDGYPLLAFSYNLDNWYYFNTTGIARRGEGTPEMPAGNFKRILYNPNTLLYQISCSYINYDNISVQFIITDLKEYINLISSITKESDMSFSLKQGDNTLFITNGIKGILTYRQKYIGV